MYRFAFCCFLLIYVSNSFAQKTFSIDGTIKGRDTGSIVLCYTDANGVGIYDTTQINKGQFHFSGEINEPVFSTIFSNGKGNRTSLFIEPKLQQLALTENDFAKSTMIGSFTQIQYDSSEAIRKNIEAKYSPILKEWDSLVGEKFSTKDSMSKILLQNKLDALSGKVDLLNIERFDSTISFIDSHPDSYVSPYLLFFISKKLTKESIIEIKNKFSLKIKKKFAEILQLNQKKINTDAPDFVASGIKNEKISLSQFKGKYLLLNFWASWCEPCIEKIPEIKQYYALYKAKGFEIINISIDQNKQKWLAAVKKYKLENFQNLIANDEIKSKYSNITQPIPSEILLGVDGKVLWNSQNQNELELNEILGYYFSK